RSFHRGHLASLRAHRGRRLSPPQPPAQNPSPLRRTTTRSLMNDSELDRLLDLAHGYIEESLSPNELAELERWLGEDAEARRRYLAFLHDHATLYWDRVGARQEAPPESELGWEPRVRRFPNLWQAFTAAAVVARLALVLAT